MVLSRCFLILFFIQIQLSQVDGSQPLFSDTVFYSDTIESS